MKLHDAALAVLCGGRATRLGGVNKALLVLDGVTFLDRLLWLRPLFADAFLVTSRSAPYEGRGLRCVADDLPALGAPGALQTALAHSNAEWTFVVGVDMPLMDAQTVTALAAQRGPEVDVSCASGQPLGAFYRTALRDPFAALLDGPRVPSLHELVASARTRTHATVNPNAFRNANTTDELRAIGAVLPQPR